MEKEIEKVIKKYLIHQKKYGLNKYSNISMSQQTFPKSQRNKTWYLVHSKR